MSTAAHSTTEINKNADFLLYMAYPMVMNLNKNGTGSHVFYTFWEYYATILVTMALSCIYIPN